MFELSKDKLYSYKSFLLKKIVDFERNFEDLETFVIYIEKELSIFDENYIKNKPIQSFLTLKDSKYLLKEERDKLLFKFKKRTFEVEEKLFSAFTLFEEFRVFLINQKIKKIDLRTIKSILNDTHKIFYSIFKKIFFIENISLDHYILLKEEIKKKALQLLDNISVITNLAFESLWYFNDIDIKKLKKISLAKLEEGDIILTKKKFVENSLFTKVVSKLIRSKIVHSSMVYKVGKNYLEIFESIGDNGGKSVIHSLEFSNSSFYLILRKKKSLSNMQKKELVTLMSQNIGRKYSFIKVFSAIFTQRREILSNNPYFPYKRRSNIFKFLSGVFCSEIISELYSKIGIRLGFSKDNSMVSPLELLNSSELEIIGYIENATKKN